MHGLHVMASAARVNCIFLIYFWGKLCHYNFTGNMSAVLCSLAICFFKTHLLVTKGFFASNQSKLNSGGKYV